MELTTTTVGSTANYTCNQGTSSAMETALALVKLMDIGLGAYPLVNVSEHLKTCLKLKAKVEG